MILFLLKLVFVYPFKGIIWCIRQGWKGMILLLAVVLMLFFGIRALMVQPSEVAKEIDIPSAKSAPYLVQTTSRYYYAKKVTQDPQVVRLDGYWAWDGKQWSYSPGSLRLTYTFGEVKVTKR